MKTLHFAVIQFAYAVMATVVMAILLTVMCITKKHVPYNYDSVWVYFEILFCAFLNMVGQNLLTYSNQKANPATVGLISYMGVFYNFLVDLFLFDIKFTQMQIIGVAICMTFSITAAIYKIRV